MGISSTIPASIPVPNSGRLGSLLRVPIDYVLEVYENDRLQSAVTLPNSPREYEQKRPSATIVTHTLNDVVREFSENHHTTLSLRGVSGYTARLGHTRDGGVSSLLGPTILREFDIFLDEYQKLAAKKGGLNVYMVFRALNEEVAYRVEPMNWEWSEAADTSRFSYNWSLELEAYAPAPPAPAQDILSPVTAALRTAQDQINRVAGAVELGAAAANNLRGELSEATNTLRSVGRVATALSNVVAQADNLVTFVTDTLPSTLVTEAGRFARAWEDAEELAGRLVADPLGEWDQVGENLARTFGYTATTAPIEATNAAGLLRCSPQSVRSSDQDPSTTTYSEQGALRNTNLRSSTAYIWRAGDTLQSLALRAYGDSSRWSEIADFNGLRSARQWGDGTPIAVGDTLAVPQEVEFETRGSVANDPFGTDIALDLSLRDIGFEDNDLALKRGRQNLEQAVALRMLTEQGEAYIMPAYGLPVRVGGTNTARELAYLASHVRDQLLRDSRVRDVRDVSVLVDGDTLAVSVSLSPVSGDAIDLVTPYLREV